MTATIRTEAVTATMEVSVSLDEEESENFDPKIQTKEEYIEELAAKHVCEQDDRLRSPRSVGITDTEEVNGTTVYYVTVHIMEDR
ncbi:hypothetical protein EXE48_12040 [Halorubrum sp. ASP1]|jgi:hypothetical protein|uniref:hypothetical protein n=1 Tax=Halorubrum sp. ASP1 TaxID=2518114 RepID=UPI0010F4BFBB|nr:hypothetical protein [Halorubrum sp. ASP1]TKX60695.1 hypothetical protein EXE48_12040 [Halorubrum sp. ASP1]